MDIFAHALWAGAGVTLARRYWPIPRRAAVLTVALAVAPDAPHMLPSVGWSLFGSGSAAAVKGYAMALPGHEPAMPQLVELFSHTLHCIALSAIIAAVVTLMMWAWMRSFWVPLFGWWSHVIIDVFTHSADYYPSPVLYPITRQGFDDASVLALVQKETGLLTAPDIGFEANAAFPEDDRRFCFRGRAKSYAAVLRFHFDDIALQRGHFVARRVVSDGDAFFFQHFLNEFQRGTAYANCGCSHHRTAGVESCHRAFEAHRAAAVFNFR